MLRLIYGSLFLSCIAGGIAETHSSADLFQNPTILEIQALHQQAEQGDKEITRQLLDHLTRELNQTSSPELHNLLLAYQGSALTLASRDAFPGPKKLEYLKTGLKTMDQAVEADPSAIHPRFIRAINNFHLPAFINRRDNARADFEILLHQIQQTDTTLSEETRQAIHYYAGLSFKQLKRNSQARETWQQGLSLNRYSELARKIALELDKLKI